MAKRCKYCKKKISKQASICPYCNQSQISLFKPIIVVVFLIIGAIASLTDNDDVEIKESYYDDLEYVETSKESKYIEEILWADLSNYSFAVEIDNYEGDVVSSGNYKFYPYMVVEGKVPQVWDIYISENYYFNISELKESEYVASVGGIDNYSVTLELRPNQYVYINTIEMKSEPTGALKIEKQ